jgi:hypothetical protein
LSLTINTKCGIEAIKEMVFPQGVNSPFDPPRSYGSGNQRRNSKTSCVPLPLHKIVHQEKPKVAAERQEHRPHWCFFCIEPGPVTAGRQPAPGLVSRYPSRDVFRGCVQGVYGRPGLTKLTAPDSRTPSGNRFSSNLARRVLYRSAFSQRTGISKKSAARLVKDAVTGVKGEGDG